MNSSRLRLFFWIFALGIFVSWAIAKFTANVYGWKYTTGPKDHPIVHYVSIPFAVPATFQVIMWVCCFGFTIVAIIWGVTSLLSKRTPNV